MKKRLLATVLLLGVGCSVGPDVKDGMTYDTSDGKPGTKMAISFERGASFMNPKKMGFMNVKITPQIAVWMEDTSGNYLGTVFVTAGFGDQKWKFYAPKGDTCGRSMCMPCWLGRYKAAGNSAPTPSKPLPDAVTGATPTGSFVVNFTVPEHARAFRLFAEWNRSFDNNQTYSKKRSSFNGQPSVVASAIVNLADTSRTADTLGVIGRGGESGTDGTLYTGTAGLTNALKEFGNIVARRK
jgi:hypothetical protein